MSSKLYFLFVLVPCVLLGLTFSDLIPHEFVTPVRVVAIVSIVMFVFGEVFIWLKIKKSDKSLADFFAESSYADFLVIILVLFAQIFIAMLFDFGFWILSRLHIIPKSGFKRSDLNIVSLMVNLLVSLPVLSYFIFA